MKTTLETSVFQDGTWVDRWAEQSFDDGSIEGRKWGESRQIEENEDGGTLIFYTRFECNFSSSPLVSSVISHLLHSFRV
jgi:hypothetical protein